MSESESVTVAVVGATGAVGEVMLSVLNERKFPAKQVIALASSRSAAGSMRNRRNLKLVEPMLQAAGGMIVWPAEYLAGVRRLCDRHGVLMIADEVLTGFGRTAL